MNLSLLLYGGVALIKGIKDYILENSYKIIIDFSICFMLCVFAPTEAYYSNNTEFWFDEKILFTYVALTFLVSYLLLSFISLLVMRTKCARYSIIIEFIAFFYFYVQGNFVPRNYGILNGETIEWGNYSLYGAISIILIITISSVVIVCAVNYKEKTIRYLTRIAIYILLIQFVTMAVLIISKSCKTSDKSLVVSDKDVYTLSEDRNIVVFILDSFDSSTMQELINGEESEWVKDVLKDFVYYPNTSGAYPSTVGGVPFILTGSWYENDEKYSDHLVKAYKESPVYEMLDAKGYSVGIYTIPQFLTDGNNFVNVLASRYIVSDWSGFLCSIYRLCAFNYSPHQIKKYFYITASDFDEFRDVNEDYNSYSLQVVDFYNKLLNDGLSIDKQKSYRVYHVMGTHPPYTFGKALIEDGGSYWITDEAKGCISLLDEFMNRLKRENIYDNTSIIVMADHGQFNLNQNPVFMVKDALTHNGFEISDKKLTYSDFNNIILELIERDTLSSDFIETINRTDRRFLYYSLDTSFDRDYLPGIDEYIVGEEARDYEAMRPTGRKFLPDEDIGDYKLGTRLCFEDLKGVAPYCVYGWGQKGYTSRECMMRFHVVDDYNNILVKIGYLNVNSRRNTEFEVNGKKVAEMMPNSMDELSFIIPHEYLSDDGILDLKIQQPSVALAKAGDKIEYIEFLDTDEAVDVETQCAGRLYDVYDEECYFGKVGLGNKYIVSGFSSDEDGGIWTDGKKAYLKINVPKERENLLFSIDYFGRNTQSVSVYANGKWVTDFNTDIGNQSISFVIPDEYMPNNTLELELDFPHVLSPYEENGSEEIRELGMFFQRIKISNLQGITIEELSGVGTYEENVDHFWTWNDVSSEYRIRNYSTSKQAIFKCGFSSASNECSTVNVFVDDVLIDSIELKPNVITEYSHELIFNNKKDITISFEYIGDSFGPTDYDSRVLSIRVIDMNVEY